MSFTLADGRGADRSPTVESTPWATTLRWMRTLVVKNGLAPILLRSVLVPMLLSFAGALFMMLGPVPIRPDAAGGIPDRDVVFLFLGYMLLGQLVVIVSGAWLHLRDVLSRSLGGIYTAVPDRRAVTLGTALVAAVVGALGALASVLTGVVTFMVVAGGDLAATMSSPRVMQMLLGLPFGAAMLSVIAVAVAVLVRQPIAAACLLVIWATYGEDAVGLIPGVGPVVKLLLPITNGQAVAGAPGVQGISGSSLVAGLWMAVLAAISVVVAVVVERRRRGWVS
ncbi:hypothetical protein KEM60_01537 [Austwickia sp. TVS 96-490-7B]|uniref:hypothetical protein n=1 Tax=Austwickia sp. TVS 96-490-7B TaxID=2830843 RepID=UPI001C561F64|nr:hypothetical protein [Austwickia sp. TVS 96-490-7B]MBW3085340.1 hypothetical protein [Austwickia sp. TVS 96-490-7B]